MKIKPQEVSQNKLPDNQISARLYNSPVKYKKK